MKRIIAALGLTLGLMFVLSHRLRGRVRPWSWPMTTQGDCDDDKLWGLADLFGLAGRQA